MACGRPLVAASVGALDDLLRDEDGAPLSAAAGGMLVPPHDAEALAAALTGYAGDAGLRARAGESARALVLANHQVSSHAERVVDFYHGVGGR